MAAYLVFEPLKTTADLKQITSDVYIGIHTFIVPVSYHSVIRPSLVKGIKI